MEDLVSVAIRSFIFQILSLVLLFVFVRTSEDYINYALIGVVSSVGSNILSFIFASRYVDFKSKNKGTYYYFTRYGKKPHTSFDYSNTKEDIYLIFGKESTGIPKEILREDLDRCMRIPMTDKVRALNLSNCAAIVIYEVLRQQNYEGLLFKEPHKSEDFIIE